MRWASRRRSPRSTADLAGPRPRDDPGEERLGDHRRGQPDQLLVGEKACQERADGGQGVRASHVQEDDAVSGPLPGKRGSPRRGPYAFRPRRVDRLDHRHRVLGVGGGQDPVPRFEDVGGRLLAASQHVRTQSSIFSGGWKSIVGPCSPASPCPGPRPPPPRPAGFSSPPRPRPRAVSEWREGELHSRWRSGSPARLAVQSGRHLPGVGESVLLVIPGRQDSRHVSKICTACAPAAIWAFR